MADVTPKINAAQRWATQLVDSTFDAMLAAWPPSTQVHQAAFYAQQAMQIWMAKLPSLPQVKRGDIFR